MKTSKILIAISLLSALVGCNRMTPDQMVKRSQEVKISCEPKVLCLSQGKVDAKVDVSFPAKYFNPSVIVKVTPVLVYDGGEVAATEIVYQGEKVKENHKVIPASGTVAVENVSFGWKEGMQQSKLEFRGIIESKGKTWNLPTVKVADGVSTLIQLAELEGFCEYKKDSYQEIVKTPVEAGIHYDLNSAQLKNKELRSKSVKDYKAKVAQYNANDRYSFSGTQIVSYTSPEGGKELNDKLSDKRSATAQKAWKTIGKNAPVGSVDVKSLGQDWDGFKEAVEKSDIKDKALILRVLSMYSDPDVRESEIKNISHVYSELRKDVLPQLRRSSFVTIFDFKNLTEDELNALTQDQFSSLDEEGLLRLASLSESSVKKELVYNYAVQKFASKRAGFNLAVLAYKEGKPNIAEKYLNALADEEDPDVINVRGLVEMKKGNYAKAEDLFEKSGTQLAKANIGVVNMLQGKYEKAASVLSDCCNKAVACLMAGKDSQAREAVKCKCPKGEYLLAVIDARQGKISDAKKRIASFSAKSKDLAERAAKDIEFAKCR